jgi:hypothetical protein
MDREAEMDLCWIGLSIVDKVGKSAKRWIS